MDAGRPVVGVCARRAPVSLRQAPHTVSLVLQQHVDFLVSAGALPVILPLVEGAERLVENLDGLLLPGGPDITPALYGSDPHPEMGPFDVRTDQVEIRVVDAALRRELPILAICRGLQLLNVVRGGTLHAHLPDVTGSDNHRGAGNALADTLLTVRPGSHLSAVVTDRDMVRCHHHQAVDRVGQGLAIAAWAPDGVVEAVELVDHPFTIGVQWELGQTVDHRLYHALVTASQEAHG